MQRIKKASRRAVTLISGLQVRVQDTVRAEVLMFFTLRGDQRKLKFLSFGDSRARKM